MPKKSFTWVILFLLITSLPFILLISNFRILLYSEDYYKAEFQKHGVYESLKGHDIEKINKDVLDYFKNKDNLINNDFFNEREKAHLLDVKKLLNDIFYLFYLLILNFIILIIALYFLNKRKFLRYIGFSLAFGSALSFLYAFVLWLALKFNFGETFTLFHKLFFKGNWMFNPLTNKMVVLYQEGFFFDFAFDVVLRTLILAFVLILIGMILFLRAKKKE